MHNHIFTEITPRCIGLKVKELTATERPKLLSLCQHHTIVLFGVYGDEKGRERLVGYCMLFSGAPTVHHYTRYISVSYSELSDIRSRQLKLIYDDDDIRLARLGMGDFDYLWLCRKLTEEQLDVDMPDHASYQLFREAWKDGT